MLSKFTSLTVITVNMDMQIFHLISLLRPLGDIIYFNPPLIINREDMQFVSDVCAEYIYEVLG